MIAAWQVRPPRLVTIAAARFMIGSQLGSVMSVTSTSPTCTRPISRASLTTRTAPAPILWPIARPDTITSPFCFRRYRSWPSDFLDFTVSGRAWRM